MNCSVALHGVMVLAVMFLHIFPSLLGYEFFHPHPHPHSYPSFFFLWPVIYSVIQHDFQILAWA